MTPAELAALLRESAKEHHEQSTDRYGHCFFCDRYCPIVQHERDCIVTRLRKAADAATRPISLPPIRYLKNRRISDETFTAFNEGHDACLYAVMEILMDAGIDVTVRDATREDFEK
jgi:hypothetical protein